MSPRDAMGSRNRVREGIVAGAGARIFYKTLGHGMPLLLLHGGPGADHTDFLPALKPLTRCCQLVLIDERGSGRSERKPVYLRNTFGCLYTRFRFALLFSRAFFVGLCIDLFRKFGQFVVSFCFFFERLLQ